MLTEQEGRSNTAIDCRRPTLFS